jgi:hypothetical protein
MGTIKPEGKNVREAIKWIAENLKEDQSIGPMKLIEDIKHHLFKVGDELLKNPEAEPSQMLIGEERVKVKQDDVIDSPKDIVHCVYNETDKVVRFTVSKLPRPTTKSTFIK